MKKIIDERQELEMMKVERTGFWIMWGVLLLSLLVQSLFLGAGPKQIAGENISFLVGCLIVVIGCVKVNFTVKSSTFSILSRFGRDFSILSVVYVEVIP